MDLKTSELKFTNLLVIDLNISQLRNRTTDTWIFSPQRQPLGLY